MQTNKPLLSSILVILILTAIGLGYYFKQSGEQVLKNQENQPSSAVEQGEELVTFSIEPELQDCVGVAPMKCMVINNSFFYDNIQGFEFEEGNRYELLVKKTKRDNVPADANAYIYTLVETISVTPVETTNNEAMEAETPLLRYSPEGTTWNYNGGTISFEGGRYSATFGCNQMNGSFSTNRTTLTFTEPASTRKACPPELQEKEQSFTQLIAQMDTYSETDDGATLSGNGQTMILTQ